MLGFLVEGAAASREVKFIVSVTTGMAHVVREDFRRLAAEEFSDWEVIETPDDFIARPSLEQSGSHRSIRHIHAKGVRQALHAKSPSTWTDGSSPFRNSRGHASRQAADDARSRCHSLRLPMGWKGSIYWGPMGAGPSGKSRSRKFLRSSPSIISNSHHAASRTVKGLLGCPAEKIMSFHMRHRILRPLLPFVTERRKTPESLSAAYAILRDYAATITGNICRHFHLKKLAMSSSRRAIVRPRYHSGGGGHKPPQ